MTYPSIQGGASLLIALTLVSKTTLIIGSGPLSSARATAALQADSKVVILCSGGYSRVEDVIKVRSDRGELRVVDMDTIPSFDVFLDSLERVTVAFITDTLIGSHPRRSYESAFQLYTSLRERNILVNVADVPDLCDFTLPATHRFTLSTPSSPDSPKQPPQSSTNLSSLQIAVTTNGKGCRLAGRIRREIVVRLPTNIGDAVENVSKLRAKAKLMQSSQKRDSNLASSPPESASIPESESEPAVEEEGSEDTLPTTPNEPVAQFNVHEQELAQEAQKRRMKWIAQVSEYWPLERLATLKAEDYDDILKIEHNSTAGDSGHISPSSYTNGNTLINTSINPKTDANNSNDLPNSHHSLQLDHVKPQGRIYLLGSGPGHPGLLTVAAHDILTKQATLVLSDKLVPAEVLAIIPSTVTVKIAKKFPGNSEGAQNELMIEAVDAARRGEIVVRLKQGDPMVYGRAGEEVLYFRKHGFESIVVPGLSSAIAGPSFAGIPVTQRGVAESMIMCTGVGRQGKPTRLPGYVRSRTLVLLMGVARIDQLLKTLMLTSASISTSTSTPSLTSPNFNSNSTDAITHAMGGNKEDGNSTSDKLHELRDGAAYPPYLPIAIIERASMPDQRVISGTLATISSALSEVGEQRPPGMIIIGWSVMALYNEGNVDILDDALAVAVAVESGSEIEAQNQNGTEENNRSQYHTQAQDKMDRLRQKDEARVAKWLEGHRYRVHEGFTRWD